MTLAAYSLLHLSQPRSPMTEPTTPRPEYRHDFQNAEPRWQAAWDQRGCFAVPDVPSGRKPKYYVLEMFPYP